MQGDTCVICREIPVWCSRRYMYGDHSDTCKLLVHFFWCLHASIWFEFCTYVICSKGTMDYGLWDSHKKKWVKHEVRSKATRIEQEENRHSRRLVYRCSTHEESVETSKLCIPHHNWHESTTTYAALGVFPQPKQLVAWIQAGINTSFTRMFENRLWYHMKHP